MVKEIKRIKYGDTVIPESWIFEGGEKSKNVPIILSFFLIITEKRKILIDTGSDTMPWFTLKNFFLPVEMLESEGVSPEEITDVVITHAHHDHIGCVGAYKNARVFIQRDEYESGKNYICDTAEVVLFDDEVTVCDGIRAVKIGGHSKGSSIVEAELDGEIYVIAGDECYNFYNLEHKISTATSINPENSKKFIEKYSDLKYKVLLIH